MVAIHELKETKPLAVRQAQEVVVRMKNDIGILFELSTLISQRGVNILAVSGGVCGEDCLVRLVADDTGRTKEVLVEHGFAPQEESVILVELPHRPGTLTQVTKTLAQGGIDIHHVYAAATQDQDKCLLAFHSSNDEEALVKLKEMQGE
jgi:hypothetical protein